MVMKYLDPKADLTFKKIFGNHPDRLKNLLNTLQSLNEDELIQQQQYLPTTEELEISGFSDAELRAYDKFWDSVSVERTLIDDSYQKGKEKGKEEGIAEGMEMGIKQGMEKGKAEGKHEANTETAQRLLAMGLSAEQVAKATQLPLDIIKNLSNS
ncbi:hypothetical protein KSW86_06705 [Prevotella copri]|uniref:Rpn family recombination-promoting nuclease/putative transposase n=2 Tax=Segatella copri TaxID=165179 RepID=A0AAW4MZW4_9BACT|nr:hypothetical protein [Segatella copri]MBV3395241.1 hypothetical protein [Segatella copri]MBV3404813.1 hypothetical protein [Segatella copri]